VLEVACAQGEIVVSGSGCYDGVADSKPMGQRIFLDINGCSMANILAQRKNLKIIFTQEVKDLFMLSFLSRALEQLHVSQHRDTALFFSVDQSGSAMVSSLYPNENVGIK
jgi:hypothetical protein